MSSVGQMLSVGHWLPWSDRGVDISDAPASPLGAAIAGQNSEREPATFYFDGRAGGSSSRSFPPAERDAFKADFCRELARIESWAAEEHWSPCAIPDLQVFVADEYKISKSLVPAWYGHSGHMEFPARRVVTRKAAIAHELAHVFFPNGNRLIAEGLAVYLQARIGSNPAFPNFGQPLHELARSRLREMVPEFTPGDPRSLDRINLAALDSIATPSPLELEVGQDFYGEEPRGQAAVYPIAGSFIEFLIEAQGMEKFRVLYMRTPLVPHERRPGSPGRWIDVYGRSLADLDLEWKSLMVSGDPGAAGDNGMTESDRGHDRTES